MLKRTLAIASLTLALMTTSSHALELPEHDRIAVPAYPNITVPIYKKGSRGSKILFVHGSTSSARGSFPKQYNSFLKYTNQMYFMDMPGHGNADKVDDNLPLPANYSGFPEYQDGMFESIIAVADHVQPDAIVCWSIGCDNSVFAYGTGRLNQSVKGIFSLGYFPLPGSNAPVGVDAYKAPVTPGVPGLPILASIGVGFNLNGQPPFGFTLEADLLDDPVPAYAPPELLQFANRGEAYIDSFVGIGVTVPQDVRDDMFIKNDPRYIPSLGGMVLGFSAQPIGDETGILGNMSIPIAMVAGADEKLGNVPYLDALKANGNVPTLWKNKVFKLPGAGHAVQTERSWLVNFLIWKFVRAL